MGEMEVFVPRSELQGMAGDMSRRRDRYRHHGCHLHGGSPIGGRGRRHHRHHRHHHHHHGHHHDHHHERHLHHRQLPYGIAGRRGHRHGGHCWSAHHESPEGNRHRFFDDVLQHRHCRRRLHRSLPPEFSLERVLLDRGMEVRDLPSEHSSESSQRIEESNSMACANCEENHDRDCLDCNLVAAPPGFGILPGFGGRSLPQPSAVEQRTVQLERLTLES